MDDQTERALDDSALIAIGTAHTPWRAGHCPKNLTDARAAGLAEGAFRIAVAPAYRAGLSGLSAGDRMWVLTWMAPGRRDLLVQHPSHRLSPTGVFALRSPVRPNPIGLALVHLIAIDIDTGWLTVDALDCFDGTPVIDLKPYRPGIDRAGPDR